MKIRSSLMSALFLFVAAPMAQAAPCLIVTVTGAQGGPQVYEGLAGPGTLVRYGDDANNCDSVRLQFDVGRGTILRLSQLGIQSAHVNAVFITHLHNDHSEGLTDLLQHRWMFFSAGRKMDVVCSDDSVGPLGVTISCKKFVAHIGDAAIEAGEVAQRVSEAKLRAQGGPAAMANVLTFTPTNQPQMVWSSGDVKVNAIRSTHIAGHASYRIDTPAGSVVIGGDAGNDKPAPPRDTSTSEQVEMLAKGADVIVHSTIHPVMGPDRDSGMPAPIYFRQSTAADLGAMAQRAGAKHLVLTHLIPPLGASETAAWKVPGGALTEADYRKAAEGGGFKGQTLVAKDLVSLRLPAK